jgi:hypothetical protein
VNIVESTTAYEAWLRQHLPVVIEPDLEYKHEQMASGVFPFLRATFYRWAERWPERCASLRDAPVVLGVGDLHVENYGTWRDMEGRLVWGVNDFDETCRLPYAADLVRLATSAAVATDESHLSVSLAEASDSILAGYRDSLKEGCRPLVLAERHERLGHMAQGELRAPQHFWAKLSGLPQSSSEAYPAECADLLSAALPEPGLTFTPRPRRAGVGSLGRPRLVAVVEWRGGFVAREVKALLRSAWKGAGDRILYEDLVHGSVRSLDPCTTVRGSWLVRRLAPDCERIELAELPAERDEAYLLRCMGRELANVHAATPAAIPAISKDLASRKGRWLDEAAKTMAEDTKADWRTWVKAWKKP